MREHREADVLAPSVWDRTTEPVQDKSIVNSCLADFAQLCLTSSDDRKAICERLKAAIERHEPRLDKVRAHLLREAGAVNRLSFVIEAQLRAAHDGQRLRFDVMLERSSLHYSIR